MNQDIFWHNHIVNKKIRSEMKRQKACVLWLTGFSGSGKSTIAGLVEQRMTQLGCHTYLLDGDNVRHGLCRDLGFSPAERTENIRRIGQVDRLMNDAGLIVLTALISPYAADRKLVRDLFPASEFIEIYVDAPLEECERRDPKGIYKKVREGEIRNFTGIDSPYEVPLAPEIHLQTHLHDAHACAQQVIDYLMRNGYINPALMAA